MTEAEDTDSGFAFDDESCRTDNNPMGCGACNDCLAAAVDNDWTDYYAVNAYTLEDEQQRNVQAILKQRLFDGGAA